MADNLTTQSATPATIPASTVIATDDAGASGHVQKIKLVEGTDGSATALTATAADGLLVNLGTNNDVTVSGVATSAKQDTAQNALDAIKTAVETLDNTVAGSELQVDVVSSALPSGASTAAKQPTLGTAGAPSTDVISVQGITSMTALKVDGSAVTQPVSLTSTTVTGTVAVTQSGTWDEVGINDSGNSITVDNPQLSVVGTGTEATALRVTIASDSTGVLSIDDNGASLTVDGTVTANLAAGTNNIGDVDVLTLPAIPTGTNTIGSVKITDGTDTALVDASGNLMVNVAAGGAGDGSILDGVSSAIKATVLDYTNSNPLAVRLTDTSGDYVGAGAGTQYTEDAAAAGDPVGTMAMAVRADTPAAVTTTDGDNIALRATNKGELYVKQSDAVTIQDGGNTITVDGALTTVSTVSTITNVVHVDDNASTLSIDDGGGAITVDGTVAVSGTVTVGSHAVTNAGTFVTQENGALLTAAQLLDDTVATLGTDTYTEAASKGLVIGAVRRDADTTLVNTTNEVSPLQVDANGRLKVEAFSGETLPVSLTSTTVTGTVAVTQSGTWDEVGINDSGNSITVDAPVGTPAFVRLSDGAAAITTLPVSLASVPSHAVTNAGTFAVQVDGAALTALQLIDDSIKVDDAAFTPATSSVSMAGFQADETATDSVDEGDAGAARMTLDRKQIINPQPHTAGGLSVANFNTGDTYTALTNTAQVLKASAGQVYGWYIYNPNSSATYVMIYNIAAASVTVGTSTAAMVLCIPATAGANVLSTMGIEFSTAISIAAATTGGGNTAPATALEATIFYK